MPRARERLSTEVANLRRTVRQASLTPDVQAVLNTGGHYQLNPDVLDVDLWNLLDLITATRTADPPTRIALLDVAVTASTAPLAEGRDYDWIDPHREHLRRTLIRAHLTLGELLTPTDPTRAATILTTAADLDPHSEDLARAAMRALAASSDTAGVRLRLEELTQALHQIDVTPSAETLDLAASLMP